MDYIRQTSLPADSPETSTLAATGRTTDLTGAYTPQTCCRLRHLVGIAYHSTETPASRRSCKHQIDSNSYSTISHPIVLQHPYFVTTFIHKAIRSYFILFLRNHVIEQLPSALCLSAPNRLANALGNRSELPFFTFKKPDPAGLEKLRLFVLYAFLGVPPIPCPFSTTTARKPSREWGCQVRHSPEVEHGCKRGYKPFHDRTSKLHYNTRFDIQNNDSYYSKPQGSNSGISIHHCIFTPNFIISSGSPYNPLS
jgi:hypothetical protein